MKIVRRPVPPGSNSTFDEHRQGHGSEAIEPLADRREEDQDPVATRQFRLCERSKPVAV